ncbi:hypothetical protein [Streptomyces collinus]|uniref:hypothetical protein n=1 Tax=Streptomyces collinus TaxID=42684 RepID=UPI00294264DA|nr:hypothetical protein [Streptomyces collinus]
MELLAIEENSVEEDSITAALQGTLPAALRQLSQIEASLAGHDALLQLLAAHLGLHPHR